MTPTRESSPEDAPSNSESDEVPAEQPPPDVAEDGEGPVEDCNVTGGSDNLPIDGLEQYLKACVAEAESRILESFEGKLKYDAFKEQQITKLHDELQEYKRGFADALLKPFVVQVVRFLDQLPRHVQSLKAKPVEDVTRERLFNELEYVGEDLQLILENVGVEMFRSTEARFDPRLQQARMTVNVDDPTQHHVVAESMLSGYRLDGKLIEKERVKVCVYRQNDGPAETSEATTEVTSEESQEPSNE